MSKLSKWIYSVDGLNDNPNMISVVHVKLFIIVIWCVINKFIQEILFFFNLVKKEINVWLSNYFLKKFIVRIFGPKEWGISDGGIRFSISKNITRGVRTIELSLEA